MDERALRDRPLDAATRHARAWLDGLGTRPVPAQASVERMLEVFGGPLPEDGSDAEAVRQHLEALCVRGLIIKRRGRYLLAKPDGEKK